MTDCYLRSDVNDISFLLLALFTMFSSLHTLVIHELCDFKEQFDNLNFNILRNIYSLSRPIAINFKFKFLFFFPAWNAKMESCTEKNAKSSLP
jgi:hypothetical protein